jgi:hypothetical protein
MCFCFRDAKVDVDAEAIKAAIEGAEGAEGAADVEPAEPEVKELSLAEYEAQVLEKKKAMGWVGDAKTAEVDMSQFEGMKAATSKKNLEEDMSGLELSDAKKKEKAAKAEKARKEKLTLEAGFRVADEQSQRFGATLSPCHLSTVNLSHMVIYSADVCHGMLAWLVDREDRGGRGGRGRSDRGGRGRGERGGGDRAGGRGRTGPIPNVMDESAFPTLG